MPTLATRLGASAILVATLACADDERGLVVPLGLPAALADLIEDPTSDIVTLGRELFFDPILSVDRSVSCGSCHVPEYGFSTPEALPTGVYGRRGSRNAPTLYNRVLGQFQMWDGGAATLEEQVLLPIANENEMALPIEQALERLAASDSYRDRFTAVSADGVTEANLAAALAAYVRTLLLGDSPVDRFLAGDAAALSDDQRQGWLIFEGRGLCWRCHMRPNYDDEGFNNIGVGVRDGSPEEGRFAITRDEKDRGAFKTPTLRGLTKTAPYMHDGSLATLEEVVAFYRDGGIANSHLNPLVAKLDLSDEDARYLVAFLRGLSQGGDLEDRAGVPTRRREASER